MNAAKSMTLGMKREKQRKAIESHINCHNNLAIVDPSFAALSLKLRDQWINGAKELGYKVTGSTLKGYRVRFTN